MFFVLVPRWKLNLQELTRLIQLMYVDGE